MRTGFIGLGAMGSSMARNLHRAGLLSGVWNRDLSKAQRLAAELGCAAAVSAAALAQACDAEALAFAAAQGLALDKVIETLGRGAAANWYLTQRGPFMARGAYPPGFRIRLHQKDLNICRAMARAKGAELPVVEAALREYAELIAAGHGDEDIAAIYRLKAALFPAPEPEPP